ncbi:hypothetical protein ACHAWF_015134 [Thalassiosira exigua]
MGFLGISISESHLVGFNQGQRGGDVLSANLNYWLYLLVTYLSGQNLSIVREKIRTFALELLQRKQQFMIYGMRILYLQTLALMEGLDFEEEEGALKALPSWDTIVKSSAGKNSDFLLPIACEAAATFYYERGLHQKAYPFFMRSVHCYKKWGAMAIASRVEQDIQIKLGMNTQSGPVFGPVDVPYLTCLTPKEGSSKRSAH